MQFREFRRRFAARLGLEPTASNEVIFAALDAQAKVPSGGGSLPASGGSTIAEANALAVLRWSDNDNDTDADTGTPLSAEDRALYAKVWGKD